MASPDRKKVGITVGTLVGVGAVGLIAYATTECSPNPQFVDQTPKSSPTTIFDAAKLGIPTPPISISTPTRELLRPTLSPTESQVSDAALTARIHEELAKEGIRLTPEDRQNEQRLWSDARNKLKGKDPQFDTATLPSDVRWIVEQDVTLDKTKLAADTSQQSKNPLLRDKTNLLINRGIQIRALPNLAHPELAEPGLAISPNSGLVIFVSVETGFKTTEAFGLAIDVLQAAERVYALQNKIGSRLRQLPTQGQEQLFKQELINPTNRAADLALRARLKMFQAEIVGIDIISPGDKRLIFTYLEAKQQPNFEDAWRQRIPRLLPLPQPSQQT